MLAKQTINFIYETIPFKKILFRCPEDYEIMGEFEYNERKTAALVRFQVNNNSYTQGGRALQLFITFVSKVL